MSESSAAPEAIPATCLPPWTTGELPEPAPLTWRRWTNFIGPGIVMMGIQIGGGEWLFGPDITAKYGGGLMWIATIAIVLQVFYNIECGRYALYCGEPIMTGFMRKWPGPMFWIGFVLLLSLAALIPGLSTNGAAILAGLWLDRPPTADDAGLVNGIAYVCLALVALPVLVGGKIYNTLQLIMTTKVVVVLGFCLLIGVLFVQPAHWGDIFSGFVKFGHIPVSDGAGGERLENAFVHRWQEGAWPILALGNIAAVGAFAGYAGGGGLGNSTYSNYVRDKGWGMGKNVGAIASAIGGRQITLSHVGEVFSLTPENRRRWRGWWRYILTDQLCIWAPGCFMGMALPALISIEFARYSSLFQTKDKLDFTQALISADGLRHAPQFSPAMQEGLWILTLVVGLLVLLPSQMSIVEDFSRRWTDIIWSGSRLARESLKSHQVNTIYYTILFSYVGWSFVCAWLFNKFGTPKLMVVVIANVNNLAIGVTSFQLLWVNRTLLPAPLRPRWYHQAGVAACGVFYLGLALLVFCTKQWPFLKELLGWQD
ncbi:MAG: Nramp family divalent metal transporter [Planctomycetales bacterium]